METPVKYQHGKHPNSIANLSSSFGGRTKAYDEDKKTRRLSVTETGWSGVQDIALTLDCRGVSELLEKVGRGELKIIEN